MLYDIVIVTYNSERWLQGCIKALAGVNSPIANLNLLFVDNASTDATLAKLKELQSEFTGFGGFTILPQAANGGFAKGCNAGAAAGKAPWVLFLNADTEVDKNIFTALETAQQSAPAKTAAFECRQLPFETGHHIDPVTLHTAWASGAALLVQREAFENINGFDTHLFMYCEDVDLSWRLRAARYTLQYVPSAMVTHYAYENSNNQAGSKLSEYAGGFYGNLLLRYKFGTVKEILQGERMYLGALYKPQHFDGVRRVLAKNYVKHFATLWPFLTWRFTNRAYFKAKAGNFTGGFAPDRGLFALQAVQQGPLVSIVIRTCGRPATLRSTLQSLQHQTYHNFEVIVVEDGPPVSQKMVENEFPTLNLRYVATQKKVGRSKAGNTGLAAAKGDYLNFLDDDDYFYPDHIELLLSQALAHPNADLITAASMAMEVDVLSREPYQLKVHALYPMRFERLDNFLLCQSCRMPIQSILFKRWLFEQHGGLNEALEGDEDWSMWLKYFAVATRINNTGVDIPRATSVFLVPANPALAAERQQKYQQYENQMLDDTAVEFRVTPRQMRQYYQGLIGDLQHLRDIGELDSFLDNNGQR